MNLSGLVGAERAAAANEPQQTQSINAGQLAFTSKHHHYQQQPLNPSKSLPTLLARNLVLALNGLNELEESNEEQQVGTNRLIIETNTTATRQLETTINTATDKFNHQLQPSTSAANSIGDWWSDYWSRQPFPSGYTQSSITLIACLLTTIIFLIVVGNLLVCIAIFTEKSLKPTQNWFIASLAVSDMLLGLVVMPFSLARELMGFWIFGPLWCDIHEAIDVLLTTASINTLCLISLDRYWSITQAVSYLKKRTPRRGAFMIAFVWFFSAAVSLPPLFGWKKQSPNIVASNSTTPATPASGQFQVRDLPDLDEERWPPSGDDAAAGGPGSAASGLQVSRRRANERRAIRQRSASVHLAGPADELAKPHLLQGGAYQHSVVSQATLRRRGVANDESDSFQLRDSQPLVPAPINLQATQRFMAQQQSPPPPTPPNNDQTATEYPSCQLSDDVGYVLYSALGSFYIPCAVMVFTYIKIFLAARSRARRTINKQSRAGQAGAGNRRNQPSGHPNRQPANQSGVSNNNITSCASMLVSGSMVRPNPGPELGKRPPAITGQAEPMMKGKIVIVERRKSLAASSLAPALGKTMPDNEQRLDGAPKAGATESSTCKTKLSAASSSLGLLVESANDGCSQQQVACTLITSAAKQASPSALNSSASNDSSMITVMNASMNEVAVTRFNFTQNPDMVMEKSLINVDAIVGERQSRRSLAGCETTDDESRKAASLLDAISKAGQDEILKRALSLEDCGELTQPQVPDIVVEKRNLRDRSIGQPTDGSLDTEQHGQTQATATAATNETCFMTIEEDSDMFEAQTGRTIMMIAGNASQRQANSLASKGQSGVMMTMLPSCGHQASNNLVCNNANCRRSQHLIGQTGNQVARSGSSYCGSSMTINDDYLDECVDDELLTDDCNGYSVSCALDQYCPAGSSCAHCQECERELNTLSGANNASANPTNRALSLEADSPGACKRHVLAGAAGSKRCNRDEPPDLEAQSITGDGDNVSHLTEYRSQEDSSSIMGHDVLDATETHNHHHGERKKSNPGQSGEQRKMSIIGFRLARLGGGGGGANATSPEQPSGLMALASSQQQQQQQQQQHQQLGATRNLKALRQNFFFKLNQLTAKSGPKNETKTKKAPLAGKSSAQSSGTSHEASVDCATTSNIHSTEYHQSTTGGDTDDFEQHTSADTNEAQAAGAQDSSSNKPATIQQGQESSAGVLVTDCSHDNKQACFRPLADKQTPYKNDDRALLLRSPQSNDRNGTRRSPSTNSMLVAQATNGKRDLDLERRGGKPTSSQLNHSPTILSANTATGAGSGTNRAYLASDNERHKRKLAKARERRATLILGLIMTTFVCSWLPFFTFYVLRALCNSCREYIPPRFEAFIFWMGYCNSAINPIIYTIFNRDFRKAFRKILFKCL